MGHVLSLAVEEHFYLVWPFLALVFRSPRTFAVVSLVVFVSSSVIRVVLASLGYEPWALFHITPARLDGVSAGSFVAAVLMNQSNLPARKLFYMAGLVAVGVITVISLRNQGFDKLNPEV